MINQLIRMSVERRGFVLFLTLVGAVLGWVSFKTLPIDAVPDITNVQVQVNTSVSGLIPEEIEKLITYPIESAMGGIPDIEEVRSTTRFGLSQVTLVFKEGTDIYLARQLASEKLNALRDILPAGAQPELGPISSGLGEVYFYALEAKDPLEGDERVRQLMELRALNEWHVKPRLLMLDGVAEVNAIGGFEKQYYVRPDMEKLRGYGIHLHEVVDAIKSNNRNTGGGYIQQTAEQLLVQAIGLVRSVSDIKEIVIKRLPNFKTVTVGDVAEVGLDRELRTGAALLNGKETVIGTALMLLGENSRSVAEDVGARIKTIQKELPEWAALTPLYDRAELVNETLGTVQKNLLFGAALVIAVLLLMVGNFRVAIITAITIPLSLLFTFILMRAMNISGNLMSLGALDFGIIIDGAVIVMDNCVRVLSEKAKQYGRNLTRQEIRKYVYEAAVEIRSAAGFGQLIIIIVFLPLFALTGVEAKMFIPMAATFCFALGAAFVLSFSTIPALAATFLSGRLEEREPRIMLWLSKIYRPVLLQSLRAKRIVVGIGIASIAIGALLFLRLGADFLPQLDEGSLAIQFVRPTNISIDQSVEMQKLSEELIGEFSAVGTVFSRIGTAEVATDPMGPNISDTYVLLKPKSEWGEYEDKMALTRAIKSKLELSIPGQSLIFSQPIQLRFNELLEGVRADVALKFYGEDLDTLSELSSKAAEIIRTIPGAGDAEAELRGKSPVLQVVSRPAQLKKLGLSKETVLTTVETAIGGTEAGYLFEGIQRFPILVRLKESVRENLSDIGQIPVGAGEHFTVPLNEVAKLEIQETYGDIRRENTKKRAAVLINVRGTDTASFIEIARSAIEQNLTLPSGYYLEWGGSFKNLELAKQRLLVVVPLALSLVFAMIYMAFGSVLQTLLVFGCVPMALIGGVLGLMVNGLEFSISAAVGFIALSGIAVLNGVVLVSFLNTLRQQGLSGDELIERGTSLRLRPVIMTAVTDIFGFLPMMLATGAGAEVQRPLASVVVGGVASATLLTLIVLPAAYRLMERHLAPIDTADVGKPQDREITT